MSSDDITRFFGIIIVRQQEEENDLVAKRKKKGPTWSDVKAGLLSSDKKQLLKLVADLYRLSNENKTLIFPTIASKNVSGYRGIQLLRRQLSNEVEFITIMHFDSLEAVKQFTGEDYEKSYVPDKARDVLSRHDERSQHYEIKESITH